MPQPYAKKSLGQNFLDDPRYIDRIIDHVSPAADESIVEIGPGRGAITERLLESGSEVIAVELDRNLVPMLRHEFAANSNFRVIEADALNTDFRELLPKNGDKMRLVANLPYYISTAILQRLIEFRDCFSDMTLMFQLEVADRITAKAGTSDRGFLTVMVEAYFETVKLFELPPSAFRPAPKVTSAVVSLRPRSGPTPSLPEFRELVSAAFAQKRKTIQNNLKSVTYTSRETLESAGIDPTRRAESLTRAEWLRLFDTTRRAGGRDSVD